MVWKWKMKKRMEQCPAYWWDALTLLRGQRLEIAEQLENDFSSSVQVKMSQMKCISSPHQACPAPQYALNPFFPLLDRIRMEGCWELIWNLMDFSFPSWHFSNTVGPALKELPNENEGLMGWGHWAQMEWEERNWFICVSHSDMVNTNLFWFKKKVS